MSRIQDYQQVFMPPMHVYGLRLWPWWARWCQPVRDWYADLHPNIFGPDYKETTREEIARCITRYARDCHERGRNPDLDIVKRMIWPDIYQ